MGSKAIAPIIIGLVMTTVFLTHRFSQDRNPQPSSAQQTTESVVAISDLEQQIEQTAYYQQPVATNLSDENGRPRAIGLFYTLLKTPPVEYSADSGLALSTPGDFNAAAVLDLRKVPDATFSQYNQFTLKSALRYGTDDSNIADNITVLGPSLEGYSMSLALGDTYARNYREEIQTGAIYHFGPWRERMRTVSQEQAEMIRKQNLSELLDSLN